MSDLRERVLYLSQPEVEVVLDALDPVAVVSDVLALHARGKTRLADEAYLEWPGSDGDCPRSLNMPSYVGGPRPIVGTKIINGSIANPGRGLARASGVTLLFDPETARVVCIMDSASVSALRTASVTAIAADHLANAPITSLAILGAGAIARAHLALLVRRLPHLREIRVFDVNSSAVTAMQHEHCSRRQAQSARLAAVSSPEDAIRSADLIVTATTTTTGYIAFDWLRKGALIVNISLDDPLPEVVLKADRVFVDDWRLVSGDRRRLLGRMYGAGLVRGSNTDALADRDRGGRRIDGELGDILIGSCAGRRAPDEIILVNPFGLSIEDLALAAHVFREASTRGIGVYLDR